MDISALGVTVKTLILASIALVLTVHLLTDGIEYFNLRQSTDLMATASSMDFGGLALVQVIWKGTVLHAFAGVTLLGATYGNTAPCLWNFVGRLLERYDVYMRSAAFRILWYSFGALLAMRGVSIVGEPLIAPFGETYDAPLVTLRMGVLVGLIVVFCHRKIKGWEARSLLLFTALDVLRYIRLELHIKVGL